MHFHGKVHTGEYRNPKMQKSYLAHWKFRNLGVSVTMSKFQKKPNKIIFAEQRKERKDGTALNHPIYSCFRRYNF